MSMPWFRMYAEFASDPVVQSLAFEDQRHYAVLLCLKCNGTLDRPMDERVRDRIIYRGLGLDSKMAEEVRRRLGEVSLIGPDWQPLGWDKRQYVSDNSTSRVRKSRNNKKSGNVTETPGNSSCNGPDTDTEHNPPIAPPAGGGFEIFWEAYPKKIAPAKAERAWNRLAPTDELQAAIMAGLQRAKASPKWRERGSNGEKGAFIPSPARFLTEHRWRDDYGPVTLNPGAVVDLLPPEPHTPLTDEARERGQAAAREAKAKLKGHG